MWNTPKGKRVLEGAEARLLKTGVLLLHDQISDSLVSAELALKIPTESPAFDQLEPEAQSIALAEVTRGLLLLRSGVKPKPWHDATALAVYNTLKVNVQVEIDMERKTTLRQRIAAAYLQISNTIGEYDTIISLEQDTLTEWKSRVDVLTANVVNVEAAMKVQGGPNINDEALTKAERFLEVLRNG